MIQPQVVLHQAKATKVIKVAKVTKAATREAVEAILEEQAHRAVSRVVARPRLHLAEKALLAHRALRLKDSFSGL